MADWREVYNAQCAYERMGAEAGLAGKTRDDCPYDRTDNPQAWNFWVYGCANARGELEIIRRGTVEFINAETGERAFSMTVEEAIRTGQWEPQWAKPEDAGA